MSGKTHIKFVQDYGVYLTGQVVDVQKSGIGSGLAETLVDYRRAEWCEPEPEPTTAKAVKAKNVRNKSMSAAGAE